MVQPRSPWALGTRAANRLTTNLSLPSSPLIPEPPLPPHPAASPLEHTALVPKEVTRMNVNIFVSQISSHEHGHEPTSQPARESLSTLQIILHIVITYQLPPS